MTYAEFLQRIRRSAFQKGKSRDSTWMADRAALHFSGSALKWYESLDEGVQQDWNLLRKALAGKYGDGSNETPDACETQPSPAKQSPDVKDVALKSQSTDDHLLPARVEIINWTTPSLVSKIRFPKSEGEWLEEARQRKAKFGDRTGVVHWRLVETWEPIPGNAIPTGNE
ncbi:hypothetical protein FRC00_004450, partial [Tulasnella sp. 408]